MFLIKIRSISKEITNIIFKKFELTLWPPKGFQTHFFCEKSSNFKHMYLQTLLERETFSLQNTMILVVLVPPGTEASGYDPNNAGLTYQCDLWSSKG